MNGTQFELDFTARAADVTASEIDWFVRQLNDRQWHTARALGATKDAEKRKLRAIAEAADGKIIVGQKGYKLTAAATPDEIAKFHWMARFARNLMRRYVRTLRVWHAAPNT